MPRIARSVLLAVLGVLFLAAPAQAATAWVNTEYHYLVVLAGPGGENLSVSAGTAPGSFAVVSHGGTVTPEDTSCAKVDTSSVSCTGQISGVYLAGGDGNDILTLSVPTALSSYVVGGDGNDQLLVREGAADQLWCGAGTDLVVADTTDAPATDCETVQLPSPAAGAPPAPAPAPPELPTAPAAAPRLAPVRIAADPIQMSASGAVRVALHCPATETRDCTGRITIRLRGAQASAAGSPRVIIGRAQFRLRPGTRASVRVLLSRNGRQRILRRRRAQCSVVARSPQRLGPTQLRAQNIVITAPTRRARS